MNAKKRDKDEIKRYLIDSRDVAKMLGISVRRVGHMKLGQLPKAVTIDGQLRWHLDEIQRWLDAGCPDRETWEALKKG